MDEKRVRSEEARRLFRVLLNAVERNDAHITILRYDTPAAVLVPVEWHREATEAMQQYRHTTEQEKQK
jgi:PHD/YefM family antitoxin component YafN of YafNO toxin-antitoxin module